jgi:hypothetical protein
MNNAIIMIHFVLEWDLQILFIVLLQQVYCDLCFSAFSRVCCMCTKGLNKMHGYLDKRFIERSVSAVLYIKGGNMVIGTNLLIISMT